MSASLRRVSASWQDFSLCDSGDGEKCERFGDIVMVRPEPQALWHRAQNDVWDQAHLTYRRQGRDGEWLVKKTIPEDWTIGWEDLIFRIRPTSFKHTGLFPEQSVNWQWIRENMTSTMSVLNLFGYTGGATLAAASVGAQVTHVDASKPVVTWGKENAELSHLSDRSIRWIVDDVQKFVAREERRGKKYDVIMMDPPAFGRGPEGELWQFETHLPGFLTECVKLLQPESGMIIINAYSLGFPALSIENLLQTAAPFVKDISALELTLQEETPRNFLLPTGIVVRGRW